jgi:hypothetical protein
LRKKDRELRRRDARSCALRVFCGHFADLDLLAVVAHASLAGPSTPPGRGFRAVVISREIG